MQQQPFSIACSDCDFDANSNNHEEMIHRMNTVIPLLK